LRTVVLNDIQMTWEHVEDIVGTRDLWYWDAVLADVVDVLEMM